MTARAIACVAALTSAACGPAAMGRLPPGGGGDPVDLGHGDPDDEVGDDTWPDDGEPGTGVDEWPDRDPEPDPAADAALDADLDALREDGAFPGLSAAIVKDGALVWAGAYGWADIEQEIPVTTDTVFMLASISKTFVSTAVLQLVEDGTLDLDADVSEVLPFWVTNPWVNDAITLRMLLTHTSSLRDDWDVLDAALAEGDSPIALGDFLADYVGVSSHFDQDGPGATMEYANVGVDLAAYAVESATGIGFDRYCEQNIFEPLGMTDTSWRLDGLDGAPIAVPYDTDGTPLAHFGFPDYPSGGLRTTAPQLARFLAAIARGGELDGARILEAATVEETQRVQFPEVAPGQGLVWYWEDEGYGELIGHSGGYWGVATLMALRPADGVGTILLTNGNWDPSPESLYFMQERLFAESERF